MKKFIAENKKIIMIILVILGALASLTKFTGDDEVIKDIREYVESVPEL